MKNKKFKKSLKVWSVGEQNKRYIFYCSIIFRGNEIFGRSDGKAYESRKEARRAGKELLRENYDFYSSIYSGFLSCRKKDSK